LISLNGIRIIANENVYKNFIPNFTVNHYGRMENSRKYKNRQNKINEIKNKDIHINSITLFDITNIMILFTGGTYFVLKTIHKKESA